MRKQLLCMSAFLLLSVAGCSNDEGMNELVQVPMPEAEDELSYDDNPTTLIGRWHMVKMVAPDSTATIAPGKVALTILDNGYAVVKDDNQRPFRQLNYQYYVDKERSRLGFDVGGIVGTYYCTYEFSEDGMLRMDYMKCSYYFRKLKHEGDFSDINYDELKYRYTYTDTLYIASHLYHQSNGSPFYLVCQGHSNPDAWRGYYGKIEGFDHQEGYEVKAAIWFGVIYNGCAVGQDARLVEILESQQKQSENIPEQYLRYQ